MFQSIIHPRRASAWHVGLGLWLSLWVHAGVGLGLLWPLGQTKAAARYGDGGCTGMRIHLPPPPDNDPTHPVFTRGIPAADDCLTAAPDEADEERPACVYSGGMTRPELISSDEVRYTPEALAARVRGIAIARCTLTQEGTVEDCRIIKSVPHMDEAVIQVLEGRRYRPLLQHGKPLRVSYTFILKLAAP